MYYPTSSNWRFYQPALCLKSVFQKESLEDGTERVVTFRHTRTCREGTIADITQTLKRNSVVTKTEPNSWRQTHVRTHKITLDFDGAYAPGATQLGVARRMHAQVDHTNLYEMLDCLLGPIAVLLHPNRPKGEWSLYRRLAKTQIFWGGVDNSILRHPSLVAITLGLFRQAILLEQQGFYKAFRETAEQGEAQRIMVEVDIEAARKMVQNMRPWIEVVPGQGGAHRNYPFPKGYFSRSETLIDAIGVTSLARVFPGGPQNTWGVTRGWAVRGVWEHWGEKGSPTKAFKNLITLAEKRKVA